MKRLIHMILLLAMLLSIGCTNSHSVYLSEQSKEPNRLDIEKFNLKMRKIHFVVVMKDGTTFEAHDVILGVDSTFFIDERYAYQVAFLTKDIDSFRDTDHFLGGFQGLFLGAVGGVILIGGAAYLTSDNHDSENYGPALIGFGGGIIGGLGGLIFGSVNGYTDVYEPTK